MTFEIAAYSGLSFFVGYMTACVVCSFLAAASRREPKL
jgi:hypothetical protein